MHSLKLYKLEKKLRNKYFIIKINFI
jgi:hypothetical protein